MARNAASSTRFATSRMTAEVSVWIIVLFINDCEVARPGNSLEFSRLTAIPGIPGLFDYYGEN